MKSSVSGKFISAAEVTNVSSNGIWILFFNKEYFLPFSDFPWFKEARISEIQNITILHKNHLHWPDLDVDLTTDMIENLEAYPLVYKV